MPRRRKTEDQTDVLVESTRSNGLRPTIDRFADDTSMLGFRYLHTRYKTWFRLVWALVLFFFVGLTVYQVCERIAYYFIRNPLTTRRSYDTPQFMNFPTVGICNKMQLKASAIADRDPSLVRAMVLSYDDDSQVTRNESFLRTLELFDSTDMLEVHRAAHQTVEDLFVSCELGKAGSCQDDIRPVFTPNGLCFAVSPNITVRRPGPETTLSLLLNLEVYDIVPGQVNDPGVTLSIYEEGHKMTEYSQGIHLEAGKVVTIPVNEVRKLTRYSQYCGRRAVGPFERAEYSMAACQWANTMQRVERMCGCRPIASPYNRAKMSGDEKADNSTKRSYRRRMKTCTFRQEMSCVSKAMTMEPTLEWTVSQECPEDCEDVSFSTVVFGGSLVPSEIASLLPSDWEDQKEKRMANFQKALDVIPNERIPVVRAVQSLANEAQLFIQQALEVFDVHPTQSSTPCFSSKESRSIEHILSQLKSREAVWERTTTYLARSLSREMNSTAIAIGLSINDDGTIAELHRNMATNYSLIAFSLLQLGSTEAKLSMPHDTFGLKLMDKTTRERVIAFVLPFVREMRECITKLHDNPDRTDEIARECRRIFREYYDVLLDARTVYNMADPTSEVFVGFEDLAGRISSALRSVSHANRVKALDWRQHEINLKQFEALYREGGRDNNEILELMKLRKPMLSDIIDVITDLLSALESGLQARRRFLDRLGFETSGGAIEGIETIMLCLYNITTHIPSMKKNSFVRGEWLSRVQRQVQVAQSYAATPQYDQVNLLHIKLYFAHFKQETIVQERSYNMFLLLAEIGGTIGLYVGATLLTVAETVVFFFEKRTRHAIVKPAYL